MNYRRFRGPDSWGQGFGVGERYVRERSLEGVGSGGRRAGGRLRLLNAGVGREIEMSSKVIS